MRYVALVTNTSVILPSDEAEKEGVPIGELHEESLLEFIHK